jgi:hypothetical protein
MIDKAFIIAKLREDANSAVGDIKRLFDDRSELRRLVNTDPDLYNELSIHEWHPTLAGERAARFQPLPAGRYVCPKCHVVSGIERVLMETSDASTLVECAYCGYKLDLRSLAQTPVQAPAGDECATDINLDVHRSLAGR